MTGPLIAVVGLKREGELVGGPGVVTVAGGGDAASLRARLEALTLAATPPGAVISVGVAGALDAALRVGDWVIATEVIASSRRPADAAWIAQLQARLPHAACGLILGQDRMIVSAAEKAALHAATGALAVDMESHVAAAFAAAHGLPFAGLRVISDTADRDLPSAVLAGMRPDGGMDLIGVLKALARDPRQLPALIRTGRDAEVAFRRLALLRRHDLLRGPGV